MQRLEDEMNAMPVPGEAGRREGARNRLDRLLRRRSGCLGPGLRYAADKAVEAHGYDRVRSFLAGRHETPPTKNRTGLP